MSNIIDIFLPLVKGRTRAYTGAMRALAPLPAFLLLAASAAACPFGFPGHIHAFVESGAPAAPMPEGRCTGRWGRPPAAPPASGRPYDLAAHPVPAEHRAYWELIGYRFDDAAGRVLRPDGAVLTEAALAEEHRPFDASFERLEASLWMAFTLSGYRLDEATCRLMGPDGQPLNAFSMKVWAAMAARQQSHAALEALLAKLRGLDPAAPVPPEVRAAMLELAKAGTRLPPEIKSLVERNSTTVAELRAPAAASYADSTRYFDGQRTLADTALAVVPAKEPAPASRRKEIADPAERALGRTLGAAFNAELAKTAPGRELLAKFRGPKGDDVPDVMVLKLTQSPNDPHAPGAVYDPSSDRMIINHWEIARVLHRRLPADKLARIGPRLNDAKELSKLLAEDPSLLPLVVDDNDVMYFHELLHAEQARRNRVDDELMRGNLPGANPLSKEHEAHREHCRYLLSKGAAAAARSGWHDYCLGMLRDPDAFKDGVTSRYLSTFAGSATLPDVRARQEERRDASRTLERTGLLGNWIGQKLKQFGFLQGDAALAAFGADAERREREFLAALPGLRREAAAGLIAHYEGQGRPGAAFVFAASMPADALEGGEGAVDALAGRATAWLKRDRSKEGLHERLAVSDALRARLKARGNPVPAALHEAYERDAAMMAEGYLAEALKAATPLKPLPGPMGRIFKKLELDERKRLLDRAEDWAKAVREPGDLPARIARARKRTE